MEINEKDTPRKVGETIAEKPETIDIDVKAEGWFHSWLQRLKLSPTVKTFKIKPQRVVNIYRIAARAVSLDVAEILNESDNVGAIERIYDFIHFMDKHSDDVFYIVACVIQNNHKEPKKSLIDFIKKNFEPEDLQTVLTIGVSNYNLASFINSIALITGIKSLNQKKASPQTAGV